MSHDASTLATVRIASPIRIRGTAPCPPRAGLAAGARRLVAAEVSGRPPAAGPPVSHTRPSPTRGGAFPFSRARSSVISAGRATSPSPATSTRPLTPFATLTPPSPNCTQRAPPTVGGSPTAGASAVMSPFVSPSPRKRRCRAKEQRNHNPRVGGSSPSSGMRSACKPALSLVDGHAEYIPRVPRSGFRDLAALRGTARASLTFMSPRMSPGGDPEPPNRSTSQAANQTRTSLEQLARRRSVAARPRSGVLVEPSQPLRYYGGLTTLSLTHCRSQLACALRTRVALPRRHILCGEAAAS